MISIENSLKHEAEVVPGKVRFYVHFGSDELCPVRLRGGARRRSRGSVTIPECHAGGFSEQVGVSAGAGEGQDKDVILNSVKQQPIILYMTVSKPCQVAGEGMVMVLRRKSLASCKDIDDGFKLIEISPSLDHFLQFLAEPCGAYDFVFHDSRKSLSLRPVKLM